MSLIIAVDGQRLTLDPETRPREGPPQAQHDRHDQAPAALGAARSPALRHVGERGHAPQGARRVPAADAPRAARHVQALVRRAQDRDEARRDHQAQRQAAEPARARASTRTTSRRAARSRRRTRTLLLNRLKNLGATITRSHYPLHPAFVEALDRAGIMYWVDAPVYQVPTSNWDRSGVRNLALRAATLTVRNNINNPSILTWSLANEPSEAGPNLGTYGPSLVRYIRDASHAVRELDDTRLVGLDRQSRVGRAVHDGRAPVPRRARGERVLRLVPLGGGEPAGPAVHHDRRPQRLPRRPARREPGPAAPDHRVRRRGHAIRDPWSRRAPSSSSASG